MKERIPSKRNRTKTTLINVRVEETRKAHVVAMADDLGVSPSELVRNLLFVATEQHRERGRNP